MNSDLLLLEGAEEVVSENLNEGEKISLCLNCGTVLTDKFCPHCGQSAATPSKLKMKNFGKSLIMSFGRLTPGFLNTAKGLLIHPWVVIKDHIHGKHISYSPPITMLIQIFLYATILFTLIDTIFGTNLQSEKSLFGYQGENAIFKMADQSIVFASLFVGIPLCFGIYLAYYRHGARKFNFAEYLAAFIYMFAAINLYDILLSLLNIIPGINFDFSNITLLIAISFSITILLKAFPQPNKITSVLLIIWSGIIIFTIFIFISVMIYLPEWISLIPEI